MALIARDKVTRRRRRPRRFRGYDLATGPTTRRATSSARRCTQLLRHEGDSSIEGQKSYWGDKCSDKFRKPSRTGRKPVIDDLVARRIEWLDRLVAETPASGAARDRRDPAGDVYPRPVPVLEGVLTRMGFGVGVAAHRQGDRPRGDRAGRRRALLPDPGGPRPRGGAAGLRRRLRLPAEHDQRGDGPHPHGVALLPLEPDAAVRPGRPAPVGNEPRQKLLSPTVQFRDGEKYIMEDLVDCFGPLGVSRKETGRGSATGTASRRNSASFLQVAGRQALERSRRRGGRHRPAGPPVQHLRPGRQPGHPGKLRDHYGGNVIPLDFLPVDEHRHPRPARQHVLELRAQDPRRGEMAAGTDRTCT